MLRFKRERLCDWNIVQDDDVNDVQGHDERMSRLLINNQDELYITEALNE